MFGWGSSIFHRGSSMFGWRLPIFHRGNSVFRWGLSIFHRGSSMFWWGLPIFHRGNSMFRWGLPIFHWGSSMFSFPEAIFVFQRACLAFPIQCQRHPPRESCPKGMPCGMDLWGGFPPMPPRHRRGWGGVLRTGKSIFCFSERTFTFSGRLPPRGRVYTSRREWKKNLNLNQNCLNRGERTFILLMLRTRKYNFINLKIAFVSLRFYEK